MEMKRNYSLEECKALFDSHRRYFTSGETRSYSFRRAQLLKLRAGVKQHESAIIAALKADFHKPAFESYSTELGIFYEELSYALKNLSRWMKPKRVTAGILNFPSTARVLPQPKGTSLIIAPWNYPFQLLMVPLVANIAAGNTCFLKPAEQTPAVAKLVEKIIQEHFDPAYITVLQGPGHEVVPDLMQHLRFDHVFFTGSVGVGRKIAEMAAPKLVPCTLELGGKSPAIVDASANLKVAAKRVAFGKWINAGQTCVAPDYVLVHQGVKDSFVQHLKEVVQEFYKGDALNSPYYARIINEARFETLSAYLKQGTLVFGGETDREKLYIAPTVLEGITFEDSVLQEEIFGPVLPILTFSTHEEALEVIAQHPNPLALYVFSGDKNVQKLYTEQLAFGGGMINNTVVYLANTRLPFGGIGNSGYGHYHGKYGFDTFSHQKSLMKTGTWFDLQMKYPPYGALVNKVVRWFMG
jgi:aldehyde dehydrogenase (NAD+)